MGQTMSSDEEEARQARTPVTAAAPAEPLDGAMRTGEGADDEPEMTIGDKHTGDPPLDPDGDGRLTISEAEELLGGSGGDAGQNASPPPGTGE